MKAATGIVVLAPLALLHAAADLNTVCSGLPKSHAEEIAMGERTYTVHMGGRIDGESTRDPVGYWAFEQY